MVEDIGGPEADKWALICGVTLWKPWLGRSDCVCREHRMSPEEERMVGWRRPGEGWARINTYGAAKGNPGLAGGGGLLRDEGGRWISVCR
jgi:hypothetical protein